jgi:putative intracellular protease/amidase
MIIMKKITLLFALLFAFKNMQAQSETSLVEKTIQNYINGSSYNHVAQLKSAFADDASLYLKGRDNQMKIVSSETYTSWFRKATPGSFNGRIGRVLSVDVQGDIATAKAEILFTTKGTRYVDLFLLNKKTDGWKIISKTASGGKTIKRGNKIVFFVSNSHFYGNTKISTGNSYSEIVNAYDEFVKAGYTVDFVSPKGGAISLAYINTSNPIGKKYLYDEDFMYALKHTKMPKEVNAKEYKAVYYVGGGSAMFDVPVNKEIQRIAMDVYEKNSGVISAVCHGTAGIVNLKTSNGVYLVKGKMVNGYPDAYENKNLPRFKTFPFLITKTIEERGGKFVYSARNSEHVEVDGRLVTGQNYVSSKAVALKIIELIKDK